MTNGTVSDLSPGWHPETGLYYYRARYYDPKVGRCVSAAPVGFAAGVKFHACVRNRRLRLRDPLGVVDLNLTAPGSEEHDPLDKYTGLSGGFSVGAHAFFNAQASVGQRYGASDWRTGQRKNLGSYDLAVLIRQEMAAQRRKDVRFVELLACNTGRRTTSGYSFADELSFWLGLLVKAPAGRLFPRADGSGYIVGSPGSPNGYTVPDLGMEERGTYGGGQLE